MSTVEERVDKLEQALENFINSVGIEFNKLYNSQMRTEAELKEFKEEASDIDSQYVQDHIGMKKTLTNYVNWL